MTLKLKDKNLVSSFSFVVWNSLNIYIISGLWGFHWAFRETKVFSLSSHSGKDEKEVKFIEWLLQVRLSYKYVHI